MRKILIFGNSGAGKSTLARKLADQDGLAHLDLDTLAWQATMPPERKPLIDSQKEIAVFLATNTHWVIEGCYTDLLDMIAFKANEMIFLNLPVDLCQANARQRPWEPHKYPSKAAQDKNLPMLLERIAQYRERVDTFSHAAHRALFDGFNGSKREITTNQP